MGCNPPFQLVPGDTVRFIGKHGFDAGEFTGWDHKGNAVISITRQGITRQRKVKLGQLRPSNDGKMVRKRGFVTWPGTATVVDTVERAVNEAAEGL